MYTLAAAQVLSHSSHASDTVWARTALPVRQAGSNPHPPHAVLPTQAEAHTHPGMRPGRAGRVPPCVARLQELVRRPTGKLPGDYCLMTTTEAPSKASRAAQAQKRVHAGWGAGRAAGSGGASGATSVSSGAGLARVYGPRTWFSPCGWNDRGCHADVARHLALLRFSPQRLRDLAFGAASVANAPAATNRSGSANPAALGVVARAGGVGAAASGSGSASASGSGSGSGNGWPAARSVVPRLDIVGMHRFSGSWLGRRQDGSKARNFLRQVTEGGVVGFGGLGF